MYKFPTCCILDEGISIAQQQFLLLAAGNPAGNSMQFKFQQDTQREDDEDEDRNRR